MSDGYFMNEMECFDYLDAMYNDGAMCESLVEDHLYGVYVDESERKEGSWTPAQQVSQELECTWSEIELLPSCDHEEGRLR